LEDLIRLPGIAGIRRGIPLGKERIEGSANISQETRCRTVCGPRQAPEIPRLLSLSTIPLPSGVMPSRCAGATVSEARSKVYGNETCEVFAA